MNIRVRTYFRRLLLSMVYSQGSLGCRWEVALSASKPPVSALSLMSTQYGNRLGLDPSSICRNQQWASHHAYLWSSVSVWAANNWPAHTSQALVARRKLRVPRPSTKMPSSEHTVVAVMADIQVQRAAYAKRTGAGGPQHRFVPPREEDARPEPGRRACPTWIMMYSPGGSWA